jgi:Gas vesicle protein
MSSLEHPRSIHPSSASLADILERVLDKGVVIAGDITVQLLDVELLTLKLRLLIASADTARSMGIDWWEHDPALSSSARDKEPEADQDLRARLERLERMIEGGHDGRGRR